MTSDRSEWTKLNTMQEVAAAQARGDEINSLACNRGWIEWEGTWWASDNLFRSRSRPKKKTKTVVLREALRKHNDYYWTEFCTEEFDPAFPYSFVKWTCAKPREIEVEE